MSQSAIHAQHADTRMKTRVSVVLISTKRLVPLRINPGPVHKRTKVHWWHRVTQQACHCAGDEITQTATDGAIRSRYRARYKPPSEQVRMTSQRLEIKRVAQTRSKFVRVHTVNVSRQRRGRGHAVRVFTPWRLWTRSHDDKPALWLWRHHRKIR